MATVPGRSFIQGVGETFGMHYNKGVSMGFMGRKAPGGIFAGGKGVGGRAAGFLGRAAFPLFTAYSAYSGYQEGGVAGAVRNVTTDALIWGGMRAGWAMIGGPATLVAAGIAGAGYGVYRLGEAARKQERRVRGLELGADVVDRFGTLSTMRQRSLQAIQNSHLSGRMALGSEALLLSSPYMR
jgi:hypothetical protein